MPVCYETVNHVTERYWLLPKGLLKWLVTCVAIVMGIWIGLMGFTSWVAASKAVQNEVYSDLAKKEYAKLVALSERAALAGAPVTAPIMLEERWSHFGVTYEGAVNRPEYYASHGRVWLSGMAKNSRFSHPPYSWLGTLPSELRPARDSYFTVHSQPAGAWVVVRKSGDIMVYVPPSIQGQAITELSLDGISYPLLAPSQALTEPTQPQ